MTTTPRTQPLVVHLHRNSAWGGGEAQVLALARALPAQGWRTVMFTPAAGKLAARAAALGVSISPLPEGPFGAWRLKRALHVLQPAVIHVHDSGSTGLGGSVGRALGVPVVLTRRVASPLRANWRSRRKYSPERLTAVIAISETVRDVFLQQGYPPERVWIAPSCIDADALDAVSPDTAWREGLPGDGPVIGGLGALTPKKNWAFLITVAAAAQRQGLEARWVIVGAGPEETRLREQARALGVGDRVHFTGFRPDAVRVLKALDVLFFPSRIEGASVTVREAMTVGVPVVAVQAPGTMESLGGCGWGVADGDIHGALLALREALAPGALRRDRIAAARTRARTAFTVDQLVVATTAVYRAVAGRG